MNEVYDSSLVWHCRACDWEKWIEWKNRNLIMCSVLAVPACAASIRAARHRCLILKIIKWSRFACGTLWFIQIACKQKFYCLSLCMLIAPVWGCIQRWILWSRISHNLYNLNLFISSVFMMQKINMYYYPEYTYIVHVFRCAFLFYPIFLSTALTNGNGGEYSRIALAIPSYCGTSCWLDAVYSLMKLKLMKNKQTCSEN